MTEEQNRKLGGFMGKIKETEAARRMFVDYLLEQQDPALMKYALERILGLVGAFGFNENGLDYTLSQTLEQCELSAPYEKTLFLVANLFLVETLNLYPCPWDAMRHCKIREFCRHTAKEILAVDGLGPVTLKRLRDILAMLGLSLAGE